MSSNSGRTGETGEDAASRAVDERRSLHEEVERLRAEVAQTLQEIATLRSRQRDVMKDTAVALSTLTEIRTSNSWRLLEAYRRLRLRLQLLMMRGRLSGRRGAQRQARRPVPAAVRRAPLGVNVAGYISTESGMGEAVRASIRSLEAAGIPFVLNNVESFLRQHDRTYVDFTPDNPHPFNLVHLNADNMAEFCRRKGRRYFRDRYTIGYWFWELSTFREEWLPAFQYVDEVWVASEFSRECLSRFSSLPILCMPLPVVLPGPSPLGRHDFGLPDAAVVFLFTFDVSSQMERKNPLAVIRAFRRAAFAFDEAVLVLKFTNPEYDRAAVRRLREEATGLNVRMLDGYLSRRDLVALLRAADCYVALHRSEGFGLSMAEAMILGKPVIATAYSGNLDFMTAENSYLVDHRPVRLTRDYGPYPQGAVWAEPDLDQAAAFMREVVANPEAARNRGQRAAVDIAAARSPSVTGSTVRRRLESLQRGERYQPGQCGRA